MRFCCLSKGASGLQKSLKYSGIFRGIPHPAGLLDFQIPSEGIPAFRIEEHLMSKYQEEKGVFRLEKKHGH